MPELTKEQQDEQLRLEALNAIEEGPGDDPELCDCTPNDPPADDESAVDDSN
jgi:hypothetical protein